jgi:hypothetical protein
MIQVDADVLLIDEVLAVGDASFQQKCFDVFHRMRDEGKTIIFVTHDMAAVQRFCHRAMLLERGEIRALGEPDKVAADYIELNFGRDVQTHAGSSAGGADEERYGDRAAEVVETWFEDAEGVRQTTLAQGQRARFRARLRFNRDVEHPGVAVLFENDQHHPLFVTHIGRVREKTGIFGPGDEAVFSVDVDCVFAPGRLYVSPWIAYRGGRDIMDSRPRFGSIIVTGTESSGGLVDLPHDVDMERVSEPGLAAGSPRDGR